MNQGEEPSLAQTLPGVAPPIANRERLRFVNCSLPELDLERRKVAILDPVGNRSVPGGQNDYQRPQEIDVSVTAHRTVWSQGTSPFLGGAIMP
jgi:hypothetical protein